jgi:DNA processing protein
MNDARLQVAFGGLHPDRVRDLYGKFGPDGTRSRIVRGGVKTTPRARAAVAVAAEDRRRQLRAAGVDAIFRGGDGYPEHLAEMPDAPDLVFVRGVLPPQPAVAVVGTRRCTSYGTAIARDYGNAIAGCGWPLVSGLARGIDGSAHRGTVGAGGLGIAVLGSGIDVMYPREHTRLARDLIAGGGAVVSEAPPGTPPESWRFPPRNRIISGLAAVVVVVEATVKGGALITAEAALRHGRQVFAVPGDIGRDSSAGCNLLIRDGAFPVLDPDDLVESLELLMGPAPHQPIKSNEIRVQDRDKELLDLVTSGVSEVDEIIARCGAPPSDVLATLGRLEISGALRCEAPGRYTAARCTVPGN